MTTAAQAPAEVAPMAGCDAYRAHFTRPFKIDLLG
jgi:hypothetical protein